MGGLDDSCMASLYYKCQITTVYSTHSRRVCLMVSALNDEHRFVNVYFYLFGYPYGAVNSTVCEDTKHLNRVGDLCASVVCTVFRNYELLAETH